MAKLSRDLREIVESFNSADVEYVVMGGHALAFHARPRLTLVLELFARPAAENGERILQTLAHFGFHDLSLKADDFDGKNEMIQLGYRPNRIDVLMRIDGVSFDEVWKDRQSTVLDSVPVHIISREHLIRNKLAAGQAQDLADVSILREIE